jgi:hypothetical protein
MDSFCELCSGTVRDGEALCASCASSAGSYDRVTLEAMKERVASTRAMAAEYRRARTLVRRVAEYRAEGAGDDDARIARCFEELMAARSEVRRLRTELIAMRSLVDDASGVEGAARLLHGVRKAVPRALGIEGLPDGKDKSGFGVG